MLGTLFNHRYRIEAELGQGGVGIVYRGHDTVLERDVAIKVLSSTDAEKKGIRPPRTPFFSASFLNV
jgi:serine/threonine-protein kinase